MDFQTAFKLATVLSMYSIAIPLAYCIRKFKTLNTNLRVLFLYLLFSASIDLLSSMFAKYNIATYSLRHTFTIIEFTFISYFFYTLLTSTRLRAGIRVFYVVYFFLAIYVLAFKDRYNERDNILTTAEAFIVIIFSFAYFFKAINNNPSGRVPLYYSWFISAFMIYFCLAFAIFAFSRHIEAGNVEDYNKLYFLQLLGSIIYNLLIAVGVWVSRTK